MKNLFLLGACLLLFCSSFSQQIPDDFLGHYKGKLEIFSKHQQMKVDMEFKLTATDNPEILDYVLIYHSPKRKDVREYILKLKDSIGNYELDEQNGIVIPTTYVNNSLHSFFKVQNNLLKSSIRFDKDYAEFEIVMANVTQVDTTSTHDRSFEVYAYPVGTYQFARLEKQE